MATHRTCCFSRCGSASNGEWICFRSYKSNHALWPYLTLNRFISVGLIFFFRTSFRTITMDTISINYINSLFYSFRPPASTLICSVQVGLLTPPSHLFCHAVRLDDSYCTGNSNSSQVNRCPGIVLYQKLYHYVTCLLRYFDFFF